MTKRVRHFRPLIQGMVQHQTRLRLHHHLQLLAMEEMVSKIQD